MTRPTHSSERVAAFIALGSNVGDRAEHLRTALTALAARADVDVLAVSGIYDAEAHVLPGAAPQAAFLNAVAEIRTTLAPRALLGVLHALEREAGRERSARWAPRTLDLDLLLYGDHEVAAPDLTLPHPRMPERRFVLEPLAEIAPEALVPPHGRVADLLAACADPLPVRRLPDVRLDDLLPMHTDETAAPQTPEHLRYVVVEGVIGAGKTTLAGILAERLGGRLVLEEFEENPFLERFYSDRPRWAFQTQLAFLASRFRQQQGLAGMDLFHNVVVSDYAFDKDRIFAHQNLDGDELQLYETLFSLMQPSTPTPDLIVYLQSSTERLLQNIRKRGRAYEEDMDPGYIASLNDAYNYFFARYAKSPLLVINATEIDFVENPDDLAALLRAITGRRHTGSTYLNPAQTTLPL